MAAPAPSTLEAELVLKAPAGRAGNDRIALLRAIRDTGSISAAARAAGLSYKAAWDAVQVLNNLFDRPLVLPSAGGREGGASLLTPAGTAVIAAVGAAQAELADTLDRLRASLAGTDVPPDLLWSLSMRTSARNALRGRVVRIVPGAVNAEVVLEIAEGLELVAIVTGDSVADLGLAPGTAALALIKASFVILVAGDDPPRTSARNALPGTVIRREDGAVSSEVTLELQPGRTLAATVTRESADALGLAVGMRASALVKASHVIVALA